MKIATNAVKIVLVEPEIPHNTGAIGRSCLAFNARLHLVRPFGFQISDEQLRRSGLDYWQYVNPVIHDSLDAFLGQLDENDQLHLFTTKASRSLSDVDIQPGSWLLFGPESRGLDTGLLQQFSDRQVRIRMDDSLVRSLNLANAVSIALYEADRQLG